MLRNETHTEADPDPRLARIREPAVALFEGDADAAERWLNAPNRALGGKSPAEFAQAAAGEREVERLMGRLEHGVFT